MVPWSKVLPQKLTISQIVKKLPAFYGTRRFITAVTSARHLSLSWARSIQSIHHIPLPEDPSYYFPPIYAWVFHVASFPQDFQPKSCMLFPIRATCPVHLILLYFITRIILGEVYRSLSSSLYSVIHKSLRDFRTRLRNNQDRHGRKEHINW